MVQDACDKVGIPRLSTVIGSSSPDARQMLVLINQESEELGRRTAWQAMVKEHTFAALGQEEQTGKLPSDVRFMVNETFYNRTRQRIVQGPIPPSEWQMQKATTTQIFFDQYRLRGDQLLLLPIPSAGDEYAFEYVSKNWATNQSGTIDRTDGFIADSDQTKLNVFATTLGIVWRWKMAKGLDYAEDYRTYEVTVANLINRDGSKRTISMSGPIILSGLAVQEGSWPL
jgi:hypothetical protein